jgi:osmoprotectant transport system ATP-binding protein
MPSTTGEHAALSAARVSKRFGPNVALDDVSLTVSAGESVALVGESGSGKTTLLRCFNRLVDPDCGMIRVAGNDVAAGDPVCLRRHIGYVPQDGGLLPHWAVQRNVELVLRLLGRTDAAERARATLTLVGLDPAEFGTRRPSQLSGGQRQRVAIARALAPEPLVILLDEPFSALDAITRSELQDAFIALRARLTTTTTVLVTHDLHEALLIATLVVVMRRGRIEQAATPRELLSAPATEYVRTLLHRARVDQMARTQ